VIASLFLLCMTRDLIGARTALRSVAVYRMQLRTDPKMRTRRANVSVDRRSPRNLQNLLLFVERHWVWPSWKSFDWKTRKRPDDDRLHLQRNFIGTQFALNILVR